MVDGCFRGCAIWLMVVSEGVLYMVDCCFGGIIIIIRQPLCPVVGRRPQHVVSK